MVRGNVKISKESKCHDQICFSSSFSVYNFKICLWFNKVISRSNDIGRNYGISFNLLTWHVVS